MFTVMGMKSTQKPTQKLARDKWIKLCATNGACALVIMYIQNIYVNNDDPWDRRGDRLA